jgi:diketogulonate reductase-like aldo/keto reductase
MTSLPAFEAAPDAVDPRAVPRRRLRSGAELPAIALGTFGSDRVSGEAVAHAVVGAASLGYRHFDCAAVYRNEHLIGPALKRVLGGGVPRQDLWVTSKLWNDKHARADVSPSFRRSLADLRLAYLDLYLVHWPFPNFHPPGCDVTSRSPDARPYFHEAFMRTWRELEKLVDLGLVRHIGTSNMTIPKRPDVERLARWKLHPEVTVTHRFPLQRAAEAYRVADEGRSGKVVITFGGA